MHFRQPMLKNGCKARREDLAVVLSCLDEEFTLELDEPGKIGPVEAFILSLEGALSADEAASQATALSAADIETVLMLLDENLLLAEGVSMGNRPQRPDTHLH